MTTTRYRTKPTEVTAVQFNGYLESVEQLVQLGAMVSYTPRGFDHRLREAGEKDRSRGDTLEEAPPFLVLFTTQGGVRVDRNDWVVNTGDGPWRHVRAEKFAEAYEAIEVPA